MCKFSRDSLSCRIIPLKPPFKNLFHYWIIPDIPEKHINLKLFFSFLFGDGTKDSVLKESRDITGQLSHVLSKEEATDVLIDSWDLDYAFELSDGEEQLINKKLNKINSDLERIKGIIHRNKTDDIKQKIMRCWETLERIVDELQSD